MWLLKYNTWKFKPFRVESLTDGLSDINPNPLPSSRATLIYHAFESEI
ncbi:MAG: hypothetical protein U5L45_06495 [Saprospiraceae bacterium]|nr:hypothetical protein [Saprospiraceae bacterium]